MGMVLELDAVPLREEGMTPYEILLSESQERMLLVAKAGREAAVQAVFARWDLEAAVVGGLTDDGVFRARWRGAEVCALPAVFETIWVCSVCGGTTRRCRVFEAIHWAPNGDGGAAPSMDVGARARYAG